MAIRAVLGVLFFLLMAGCLAGVVLLGLRRGKRSAGFAGKKSAPQPEEPRKRAGRGKAQAVLGALSGLFFLLFLFIPFSFHQVNAGEIAVVKHLGQARTIRTAGTYFDFWMTETYLVYDAKVQNRELSTSAYSKDAQTMDLALIVQFKISADRAMDIANSYGTLDLLANRIDAISLEKSKAVLSQKSAMTIIETRSTVSGEVEQLIQDTVNENYFVDIVAVVITNIDFSDAFEKTVEDKMIAEQEKLKAQYEKEKAIIDAERELEVKKLEAEAKIAMAEADAKSQIAIARAEAQAIQMKSIEAARMLGFTIQEQQIETEEGPAIEYTIDFTGKDPAEVKLISEYLKYLDYLSKWDGKLPQVVMGDGGGTVVVPIDPTQPPATT